jgi:hypothetical protein
VPAPPLQTAEPAGTVIGVTRGTDRSVVEITESGRREIKVSGKTTPPASSAPQPE